MSEYINAKELRKAYRDWFDTYEWHHDGKDYKKTTIARAVQILDAQPTTDVAPVVHGEWIPIDIGDCCYRCSKCDFVRDAYLLEKGTYCPNCGARMDKRREDDKGRGN